jgi:hypothetical protein
VGPEGARAEVLVLGATDWKPGTVVWRRYEPEQVDVALVKLDVPIEGLGHLSPPPAVTATDVEAVGYPVAAKRGDLRRDTIGLHGKISQFGGAVSGRMQFTATGAPPADDLRGLSGGPLLTSTDGIALAVVATTEQKWTACWGTPLKLVYDDSGAQAFLGWESPHAVALEVLLRSEVRLAKVLEELGYPIDPVACAFRLMGLEIPAVAELGRDLAQREEVVGPVAAAAYRALGLILLDRPEIRTTVEFVRTARAAGANTYIELSVHAPLHAELGLAGAHELPPCWVEDSGRLFGQSAARVKKVPGARDSQGEELTRLMGRQLLNEADLDWLDDRAIWAGVAHDLHLDLSLEAYDEGRLAQIQVALEHQAAGCRGTSLPTYLVLAARYLGRPPETLRAWAGQLKADLGALDVIILTADRSDRERMVLDERLEQALLRLLRSAGRGGSP